MTPACVAARAAPDGFLGRGLQHLVRRMHFAQFSCNLFVLEWMRVAEPKNLHRATVLLAGPQHRVGPQRRDNSFCRSQAVFPCLVRFLFSPLTPRLFLFLFSPHKWVSPKARVRLKNSRLGA